MFNFKEKTIGFIVAAMLTACSNEPETSTLIDEKKQTTTSTIASTSIAKVDSQTLSKPDASSMESQVAQIMDGAWTQLQENLTKASIDPKQKAEAYAQYGLTAFGNGLAIPAKKAFELSIEATPNDVRWIYYLALIHEYLGELELAVTRLVKVLSIREDDKATLIRLGGVYFEQSKFEESKQAYQRVVDQEPTNAAGLAGLARIAAIAKDHQTAVELFEIALKQQPSADQLYYALGLSLRALGKKEEAKAALSKRGSNEPSFEDPLFDEITGGQDQAEGLWTHMTAGSQALVEGNYLKAAEAFELATIDLPEDPRSWQSLGLAKVRLNDLPGAIEAYRTAETLSPENPEILFELGKLFVATSNIREAESYLLQAVDIDSGKLEIHTEISKLYQEKREFEKALTYTEKALELDPQSSNSALMKAELLVSLGRQKEALKTLSNAVNVNPNDLQARLAYGLILSESGNPQDGLVQTNIGLKKATTPIEQSRAYYALATIQTQLRDTQAALDSYSESLRLDTYNYPAAFGLARTFLRIRDYKKAVGTYEVLIKHQPNNDSARIEAAQASLMLGDGQKAKSLLKEGADLPSATDRLLGSYARLLILSTQESVKDTKSALAYAERAINIRTSTSNMETLALSHSALGNYEEAISLQQTMLSRSENSSDQRTQNRIQQNLARYQQGQMGRLPLDAK